MKREDLKELVCPKWDGRGLPSQEIIDFCKSMVGKCILIEHVICDDDGVTESAPLSYARILEVDEKQNYFSIVLVQFAAFRYKLSLNIIPFRFDTLLDTPKYMHIYEISHEQFEFQMGKAISMCENVRGEILE